MSTTKEYILDGEQYIIISKGMLKPEDLLDEYTHIIGELDCFECYETSEAVAIWHNWNEEWNEEKDNVEAMSELLDIIRSELEEKLERCGMYLTTAEGDPACIMIVDAGWEDEEDQDEDDED